MMKCSLLLSILLLALGVFSLAEAEAQTCTAESIWVFDPEPVNGNFYADSTIGICVDVENYESAGDAMLTGIELDFTAGWIMSSMNVISAPQPCDSGGGEWFFLDTLICGDNHFGAGFYFDANHPITGVPDGEFCNNQGDNCSSMPQNWSFCFELTLMNNCGDMKDVDLMPRIRLLSDADLAGDIDASCAEPLYFYPDYSSIALNCCLGAELDNPGTAILCESQCLYNLFDSEYEQFGTWYGPAGYTDNSPCGFYNVDLNVPGDYTFLMDDILCNFSYTITVLDPNLGVVSTVLVCGDGEVNLDNGSLPSGGMWFDPQGNVLESVNIVVPAVNPPGVYIYEYMEGNCSVSAGFNVVETSTVFGNLDLEPEEVCASEVFSPAEAIGLEEEGYDGSWILYDQNGLLLNVFVEWQIDFSGDDLLDYGDTLRFVYSIDTPFCDTLVFEKWVYIAEAAYESVSVEACASLLNLWDYLPDDTPEGGVWTDFVENINFGGLWDCTPCIAGTYLEFGYSYANDLSCGGSVGMGVTILGPGAGSDYEIDLCATGDVVYLFSLLGADADAGGDFDAASPYVIADTSWSGDYIYTVSEGGCTDETAVYTLNFIDQFMFTYDMICEGDGTTYTAVIEFTGGQSPYFIDGVAVEGSVYEAEGLLVSDGINLAVTSDSSPCHTWDVFIGVQDSDGDGICDAVDITGCMDSEASNYNPLAINPGFCFYEAGPPDMTYSEDIFGGLGLVGNGNHTGGVHHDNGLMLKVFPNPTVGQVNIDIRGVRSKEVVLEVRDMMGKICYAEVLASAEGEAFTKIDLKGVSSGIYFVQVVDGENRLVWRLVVRP